MLGKHQGQLLGYGDDKPIVTVAAARSGKTATVLKPALFTYPGSMLVLDPKGELAAETAEHRRRILGQDVYVLDKDNCSGVPAASFNPLAELDRSSPTIVDDVDAMCETIIMDEGGSEGSHWTNSARALARGLILHVLQMPQEECNLVTVKQLLSLTHPALQQLQAKLQAEGSKDAAEATQNALFMEMAAQGNAFGGALAGAGTSFLRKASRERSSIISTAEDAVALPRQFAAASLVTPQRLQTERSRRKAHDDLSVPAGWTDGDALPLAASDRAPGACGFGTARSLGARPAAYHIPDGRVRHARSHADYGAGGGLFPWHGRQAVGGLARFGPAPAKLQGGLADIPRQCIGFAVLRTSDKVTLDYISDRLGSLSFCARPIW